MRGARWLAGLAILWGFGMGSSCLAVEKHWAAHEARLIVVGTLIPKPMLPWFDGWHLRGEIAVDDFLYGGAPRRLDFHVVVPWRFSDWRVMLGFRFPDFMLQQGLWFLTERGGGQWQPSLGFSDTGWRALEDRAYWENYIKQYKR